MQAQAALQPQLWSRCLITTEQDGVSHSSDVTIDIRINTRADASAAAKRELNVEYAEATNSAFRVSLSVRSIDEYEDAFPQATPP